MVVAFFLISASMFVLIKGKFADKSATWDEARQATLFMDCSGISCMRIGGRLLEISIEAITQRITGLFFLNLEPSAMAHLSPRDYKVPDEKEKAFVVHTAVFFAVRMVCMLPLLWLTFRCFQGFIGQTIFLVFAFMTLSGWPLPVIDLFFAVTRSIIDWPLSYYLFAQRLHNVYDFATIAVICLLVIYLSNAHFKRWWDIAAIVVFGQLCFENNGITCGVAIFVYTYLEPGFSSPKIRVKIACQRLLIAGVTSLALALIFVWNITLVPQGNGVETSSLSPFGNVMTYFEQYWMRYGSYNYSWLNVTIANFITLLSIPAIFGLATGLVSGWERRRASPPETASSPTEFNAAFAAACGFFSTLIIGFFVSGLSSDMGRQILPLTLMVLLAAIKATEHLMNRKHGSHLLT